MAYLAKDGRSPGSMMLKASLAAFMAMCAIFVVYEVVDDSHIEVERDYDDGDYEYDPFDTDPADDANFKPDKEGQAPPTPNWHACRFAAKKGGIYDIRPLSRNKKLLKAASGYFNKYDLESMDWVHQDDTIKNQTYYLNVCSDVIAVPPACRELQKMDPAPAYDVTPTGECFYLGEPPNLPAWDDGGFTRVVTGTLKTFQWRPIDTNTPMKGMELYYENGAVESTPLRTTHAAHALCFRQSFVASCVPTSSVLLNPHMTTCRAPTATAANTVSSFVGRS